MTPEADPLDEDFPNIGRGRGCNLCVQKDAAIEALRDDLATLKALTEWRDIASAPKDEPLWLFAETFIHEDFNPSGAIEGYWQDDAGWIGAVWDGQHDCWNPQIVQPTHFMRKSLPQRAYRAKESE